MTPPPKSASTSPCPARLTVWLRLLSLIRSPRAKRVNHLVLKTRNRHHPNAADYSTLNYNNHALFYAPKNVDCFTTLIQADIDKPSTAR